MSDSAQSTLLVKRWRRGTLRTVTLEDGGRVVCKRYWVAAGRWHYTRTWRLEYRALKRLEGAVRTKPLALSACPEAGGISAVFKRTFVEGEPVNSVREMETTALAALFARIHSRGVVTHDAHIDNLLRVDNGELAFIDFGKARCYRPRSLSFFFAVGREFARARREIFDSNRHAFLSFLQQYRATVAPSRRHDFVLRAGSFFSRCMRTLKGGGRSVKNAKRNDKTSRGLEIVNRRERIPGGTLVIRGPRALSVWVETFVRRRDYEALDDPSRIQTRNKRYRLWTLKAGEEATPCILKMGWVDYQPMRRLSVFVSQHVSVTGAKAFRGARWLHAAGIESVAPLAWWTDRRRFSDPRHFFMYYRIDADGNAKEVLAGLAADDPRRQELVDALSASVKRLFDSGLRHDDLAVGNFLVKRESGSWRVWLIDTDSVTKARVFSGRAKLFWDLRCLRRLNVSGAERDRFLHGVLGLQHSDFMRKALIFWVNGGNKHPLRALWRTMRGFQLRS